MMGGDDRDGERSVHFPSLLVCVRQDSLLTAHYSLLPPSVFLAPPFSLPHCLSFTSHFSPFLGFPLRPVTSPAMHPTSPRVSSGSLSLLTPPHLPHVSISLPSHLEPYPLHLLLYSLFPLLQHVKRNPCLSLYLPLPFTCISTHTFNLSTPSPVPHLSPCPGSCLPLGPHPFPT
ncbi:hypothetical protein E2C01_029986 [Portunus trituberculatus]|uniref:Uncharacterized protein n=1 Tax=Portunus trituberculatus TaxID=210409 RepID=A0A5B7EW26_PORTR|nr:hypothetical protein [Portunus trituberculatus]